MERDLDEQFTGLIVGSETISRTSKSLKNVLKQAFLESPLRPLKTFLNGTWLEHPLHPVMTDIPIGAWTVALVLDVLSMQGAQGLDRASGIATGLGTLGATASIATGLMDYTDIHEPGRSVGLTHGVINIVATSLFAASFLGRWKSGWRTQPSHVALSALGYAAVTTGAFIGGSLVYRHGFMVNQNAFREGPEKFQDAIELDSLEENKLTRVTVEGQPILLVRRGSHIYAIGAVCSHLGAPLEEGTIKGDEVECPWHYSRFALEDGRFTQGPTTAPVPAYDTRVRAGMVQVRQAK